MKDEAGLGRLLCSIVKGTMALNEMQVGELIGDAISESLNRPHSADDVGNLLCCITNNELTVLIDNLIERRVNYGANG